MSLPKGRWQRTQSRRIEYVASFLLDAGSITTIIVGLSCLNETSAFDASGLLVRNDLLE